MTKLSPQILEAEKQSKSRPAAEQMKIIRRPEKWETSLKKQTVRSIQTHQQPPTSLLPASSSPNMPTNNNNAASNGNPNVSSTTPPTDPRAFMEYAASLTPAERIQIFFELDKYRMEQRDEQTNTDGGCASTTGSFHTADELDIDSSWPTSTSCVPEVKSNNNTPHDIKDIEIRTIGRRLSWSANDTVITDLEAGRTPNYHHQHTETDTSSSNPDPFIVEAFQRYDTDGNGELSLDELKELLRSLAVTMEYDENFLDRWIQKIDKDGNGSIDFEEFLSIFNTMKENSAMDIDKLLLETFQQVRKIFFTYIFFHALCTFLLYINTHTEHLCVICCVYLVYIFWLYI